MRKAAPMTEGPWGLSLRQSKDSGSEEDRWFWDCREKPRVKMHTDTPTRGLPAGIWLRGWVPRQERRIDSRSRPRGQEMRATKTLEWMARCLISQQKEVAL